MYKCEDCEKVFEEPIHKRVCCEEQYGVTDLFSDRHYYRSLCCPSCESNSIKMLKRCECCGDYFEDLIDTNGMINGGIGCICEQCCIDNSINE